MNSKARLKITQTIFYSVLTSYILAATEPTVSGARPFAMGGLSTATGDVHTALNHPALTAWMKDPAWAISAVKPFLQAQWHMFSTVIVYPHAKAGAFSLSGNFSGTSFFHRAQISLGYARSVLPNLSLGIRFDYTQLFMQEYGIKRMYNPHLSLSYKAFRFLHFAMGVHQPIPYTLHNSTNEKTTPSLYLGITYHSGEKVTVGLEYVQGIRQKPNIKVGVEYSPITYLSIQVGYNSIGHRISWGVTVYWKKIELQTACSWQPNTGFSPALSIVFPFRFKKSPRHDHPAPHRHSPIPRIVPGTK